MKITVSMQLLYKWLLCILCICIISNAFAQVKKQQIFNIGQQIYPGLTQKIVDNKGNVFSFVQPGRKLTIIVFWSLRCRSCISEMPELENIKEKFGKSIEIILVTQDNQLGVDKLFSRIKIKKPSLPMITGDTLLSNLFPYNSVPHHVWINENGEINYITYGYNANENNIHSFIKGEHLSMSLKQTLVDFDESQPLWLEGNGRLYKNLQFYSFLMSRIEGFGGGGLSKFEDSLNNRVGVRFVNQSLLSMLQFAYNGNNGGEFDHESRIAFEVKDSLAFFMPEETSLIQEWMSRNIFCYEISLPLNKKKDLYFMMQQDLSRYFNYDIIIEKRSIRAWVLVRTSMLERFKSTSGKSMKRNMNDVIVIQNMSLHKALIEPLRNIHQNLPWTFFDGTNYEHNVDMKLKTNFEDLAGLKNELRKYDLDLIERSVLQDVLIIRDKE